MCTPTRTCGPACNTAPPCWSASAAGGSASLQHEQRNGLPTSDFTWILSDILYRVYNVALKSNIFTESDQNHGHEHVLCLKILEKETKNEYIGARHC